MTQNRPPAQAAPPRPYGDLVGVHRVGEIAKVLPSLLIGAAVTALASGVASLWRAGVVDDFLAGNGSVSALDAADTVVSAVAIADLLVFLGTATVFLVWSWRLFKNAKVLAPDAAPASGWSIGAWIIPAVLPGYFLSRVDRVSGSVGRPAQPLIVAWAVLYTAATWLSRVIWRGGDDSLESLVTADRRDIWAQLLYAAAAIVAALMVRAVTARQERALADRSDRVQAAFASREAAAEALSTGDRAPTEPYVTQGVPPPLDEPPPPGDPGPGVRGSG